MNYEFHACYPFALRDSVTQAFAIEWLSGKSSDLPHHWQEIGDIQDPLQRIAILSQAIATPYKEQARMGTRQDPGGFRYWVEHESHAFLQTRLAQMKRLGLLPTLPDISALPHGTWAIQFTFTLRTPYISKDDVGLHILDNPVRKDRVFGLPMVASTGWKGALRAALREAHGWDDDHPDLLRLCGDARDDETGHAGRLYFYPTFFTRLGLEVINPHDRQSNAGKQPIYFECVPAGAQGDFTLLYVSFDRVGEDEDETRRQALADLETVAAGIEAMMTRYGFGAKTSVGCGLAKETVSDGMLTCRIAELVTAPSAAEPALAPVQDLPRYLEAPGRLKPAYLTADGTFRDRNEAELKAMKRADRQLYDKAKAWWEREGKALAQQGPQPPPAVAVPPPAPTPTWPSWNFASFDELATLAGQVAEQLIPGGAQ